MKATCEATEPSYVLTITMTLQEAQVIRELCNHGSYVAEQLAGRLKLFADGKAVTETEIGAFLRTLWNDGNMITILKRS